MCVVMASGFYLRARVCEMHSSACSISMIRICIGNFFIVILSVKMWQIFFFFFMSEKKMVLSENYLIITLKLSEANFYAK